MSKKIQLSIHEPCHENWEKMTPVEKGRFCGSCQKQVVDFSIMSDRQVAEFFKKPSTGSVCGRFMTEQLDRDMVLPKKRIPWLKYFFSIALPAIFITKAGAQRMGKVSVPNTQKDTTIRPRPVDIMGTVAPAILPSCNKDSLHPTVKGEITYKPVEPDLILKGSVLDESGKPVEGATIIVKNTNNGVATDTSGSFTIIVREGDLLSISAIGYFTNETLVSEEKKLDIILQKMEQPVIVAGMISIDWKDRVPDPVITMDEFDEATEPVSMIKKIEQDPGSSFRIFPNPVRAGQYLSVQCSKIENGNYSLQWLDQGGNIIRQESMKELNKNNTLRTYVPAIATGSYFLVLTDKKTGKKFAQKIIIQ